MKNKIIKNIKLGLAGIVLAGSLGGCILPHLIALKKYNPLTKEQKNVMFKDLNPGLKECINKVYIIDKRDFFEKNIKAHTHVFNKEKNTICLTKGQNDWVLFHEGAHARLNVLNKSKSDFSKKWKEIADFKYGKRNIKNYYTNSNILMSTAWKDDKTSIPKNGLLTPYSARSIHEDVANFVESLSYVNEKEWAKKTSFLELYPLFYADTTDHRYKQKLDLLKEYNFLTKEEHEKLNENLGIYSHLLKNK